MSSKWLVKTGGPYRWVPVVLIAGLPFGIYFLVISEIWGMWQYGVLAAVIVGTVLGATYWAAVRGKPRLDRPERFDNTQDHHKRPRHLVHH